jgi:hypothetical protein
MRSFVDDISAVDRVPSSAIGETTNLAWSRVGFWPPRDQSVVVGEADWRR